MLIKIYSWTKVNERYSKMQLQEMHLPFLFLFLFSFIFVFFFLYFCFPFFSEFLPFLLFQIISFILSLAKSFLPVLSKIKIPLRIKLISSVLFYSAREISVCPVNYLSSPITPFFLLSSLPSSSL